MRIEAELRHHLRQAHGLLFQRLRSSSGLLHQRSVLLRGVVKLRDGVAHFFNTRALFLAGRRNLANDVGHALHARDDLPHGRAGFFHQRAACIHVDDGIIDQRLDLFGGSRAALRKAAHLTGHHSETTALFPRTRGFDCRIECKDVRLERNAINHADDVDDLA